MKILVLVAGTNEPSNSNALADACIQGIQQSGEVAVTKLRLKDLHIEHFSIDHYDPQCSTEEDFCAVQREVESAQGLVIATPVWNFGVPAHLKNLIDRFGSFALDASRSSGTLKGLPFYIIFTGGAPFAAWKGMMKRTTSFVPEGLRYFGASYIGHHFEGRCTKGKGKFGLVVDARPESLASLRKQGHEFAKVVAEYARTGKPPLKHRATAKVMRWGEKVLKSVTAR